MFPRISKESVQLLNGFILHGNHESFGGGSIVGSSAAFSALHVVL